MKLSTNGCPLQAKITLTYDGDAGSTTQSTVILIQILFTILFKNNQYKHGNA